MENKKVHKTVSFVLALVMLVLSLPVPITSQAAGTDYTGKIISIAFPRGADRTNPSSDTWGHKELRYINGAVHKENVYTNMQYMEYGNEEICYCIEPGESVSDGDSRTQKDESYFNKMDNGVLKKEKFAKVLGRLMQYGYTGTVSDSWVSQNTSHADKMAHAIATQLLVWEVIVGERDAQFNHIEVPEPYNRILDGLSPAHPLNKEVKKYYNDIVSKMKTHAGIPSFMTDEEDNAPTYNFTKVVNQYKCTLIDKNNVLSKFNFDVINISDVKLNNSVTVTKDGNKLILTSNTPVNGIRLEANKTKLEHRSSVVVWHSGSSNEQDVMTVYGEKVSDPISAYAKAEVKVGSIKINKKDNSGKALSGAKFNIASSALGINKTVTTNANGIAEQANLPFGTYTVTEVQYPTGFKAGSMSVSKGTVVSTTANSATVTLNGNSTEIVVDAVNNPKLTTIYGYKSRQNIDTSLTQISGAVIGLFEQSKIQAYKTAHPNASYKEIYTSGRAFKTCVSGSQTTAPDGSENKMGLYYFKDVPFGNYIVAEISTITGFEAPDERSIRYISINDNSYNGFSTVASSVKSLYNDKIRMINDNDTNGNGLSAILLEI